MILPLTFSKERMFSAYYYLMKADASYYSYFVIFL